MKKFLEIMALAAVLFFTAFTGYRQDIIEGKSMKMAYGLPVSHTMKV